MYITGRPEEEIRSGSFFFLNSVHMAGLWQITAQPRFTFATELQTAEREIPMW